MADITTLKMLFNRVISHAKSKFMAEDVIFVLEHTNATPIIYEKPHQNDTAVNHRLIQCNTKSQGWTCLCQNCQMWVWITSSRPTRQ